MSGPREIATVAGPARVTVRGRPARTTVVLGHGAGGGIEAADLQAVSGGLVAAGFRVVLVEQPWRVAGRKVAALPAALDAAWLEVIDSLPARRLVVGGRSAGARVACRTAKATGAVGVLALAFPLHPPGRNEATRAGELVAVGVPLLVVQGERDPFGTPTEVRKAARRASVVPVSAADHALARRGTAAPGLTAAIPRIVEFLANLPG